MSGDIFSTRRVLPVRRERRCSISDASCSTGVSKSVVVHADGVCLVWEKDVRIPPEGLPTHPSMLLAAEVSSHTTATYSTKCTIHRVSQ